MASSSGSQAAPSISNTTPTTESASQEDLPVEKIYVELDVVGNVIGPNGANAHRFVSTAGGYVRGKIPIYVKDWRKVDVSFKNAVWEELVKEFCFNVPEVEARRLLDTKFNQIWRSKKCRVRGEYLKKCDDIPTLLSMVPPKVDPIHWKAFVIDESKPEVKARNEQNSKNRSKSTYSHTMGQCSYARKSREMDKANPGKQHTRDEVWAAAHVRLDGTVLPTAAEQYEKVKVVQEKRKISGDDTYADIESDVLAEALGADKKRTRVLCNTMSLKQYTKVNAAKLVYGKASDKDTEISELKNSLAEVQNQNKQIMMMFQQFMNSQTPSSQPPTNVPTTASDGVGSNSGQHTTPRNLINVFSSSNQSATPQNLMNAFGSVAPSSRPMVELLSRNGLIVAKGWVATDITGKTCHGKTILASEKRVYVEEVIEADAPIYERPQDGMMIMQEISEGGYLIWPDVLLQYK